MYVLDSDKDIIWRSRIHVHFNYEKNPFPQTAFWRPPFPDVEIVHYCAVGASMDRLERYDFLPNSRGTAVVSNRFYDQICDTFGAEEFNSYRAIVETRKGGKLEARIVNPVNYVPCFDLERSEVGKWIVKDKIPTAIKRAVFCDGCMGSYVIARDSRAQSLIMVSDAFADFVQRTEPYGIRLIASGELFDKDY